MPKFALTPKQGEAVGKFAEFSRMAASETFFAIVGKKVNLHTLLPNEQHKFPQEDVCQRGLDLPIDLPFYENLSDGGYLSIKDRGDRNWSIALQRPAFDYYAYSQKSGVGRFFEDCADELVHESTLRAKVFICVASFVIGCLISRFFLCP